MKRRHFLAATLILASLPLTAQAQEHASADQIATYLNELVLAGGTFTQFNGDGSRSLGTFMMQKPGRIRFEYTAPDPAVVVSDGSVVGIIDPKNNGNDDVYELKRTPLSLLLRTDIDLGQPGLVKDLSGDGSQTWLTLVDPKDPSTGEMLLTFTHQPFFHLSEWTITDESGSQTTVRIDEMARNIPYPAHYFSVSWNRANFGK